MPQLSAHFHRATGFHRTRLALYNVGMSYHCLAEFIEELGQAGELIRVGATVNPVLEAAEITRRIGHATGPALLFGAVEGHDLPLATNLLGTSARICRALGVPSVDEFSRRIAELVDPSEPEGWFEKLKGGPGRVAQEKLAPKTIKSGPCQQVVRLGSDVDLDELPVLKSYPDETGRGITAAVVFSVDADTHRPCAGRYDLRVLGPDRLAACWSGHDEPTRLLAGYRQRDQRMPLAVVLGGDPAGLLAAMAPVPPGIDATALAGLFRGSPRELVKCRSIDLQVPVDADIVIEGFVDPAEPPVDIGPRGIPGGYCRSADVAMPVQVTAMTHRNNPICPAMVPAAPPDEFCVLNWTLHRLLLPLVRLAIPELVDYDLPAFGRARHLVFMSIRKHYAGQARRVAHAAWGLRQLMFSKILVIVDEEVDLADQRQVWSAIAAHVAPDRDMLLQSGPPDPLDPAASPDVLSSRVAIDATAKLAGERRGDSPYPVDTTEQVRRLVSERWEEYGLGPEPSAEQ